MSDVIGGYLAEVLWLLSLVAASAVVYRRSGVGAPTPRPGWGSAARTVPDRLGDGDRSGATTVRTLGRISKYDRVVVPRS